MNLETGRTTVPNWAIFLIALSVVMAVFSLLYYFLPDDSTKLLGLIGGIVSALAVFILTFAATVKPMQKLQRFEKMGVRALLRNRHDREYYRELVAQAKNDVRVMGASCTRFVEDFMDLESDDKVLIDALRRNSKLKVRLLIPSEEFMAQETRARAQAPTRILTAVYKEFKDRVELRRFDEKVAHSFVIVDDELVAGPVFEGSKSKYAPAVHVAMWTEYARKYAEHFDEVWRESAG
jgi:hypothetical protein